LRFELVIQNLFFAAIVYPHLSRHILAAKSLVRQCKMEMTEIDTCPECYENANTKKNWFVEVCSRPHILLWAKLKGFPYWPAKAMAVNASLVDVRFFGKHDKAWLPVKDCFLYSADDPNQPKRYKNNNIAECIKEVDVHLEKLEERFGKFNLSLFRVNYNPAWETKQWCELLPHGRKELLNPDVSPKTDLKMKIYKTADNNLSISKVEAKATSNGVARPRQVGDSPTKNSVQPPNKIKILERHTSDGKNKTYQIMKEVSQLNKTAPSTIQEATAKLEPVKLKRKFDSWSNSSKEPAEKKQRVNEEEKEKPKKEEVAATNDGATKTPSPAKEPTKSPEASAVQATSAAEKDTLVESPPSKRITRNQQSFTEAPAAKSDRTTRRSKTMSKENEEEATVDGEETTPDTSGLVTRSRRKSLAKGEDTTQKSPAKTNGKETKVVTGKEKEKEANKSSDLAVQPDPEADTGVLQIKEEPISDDETTSFVSANITANSDNFTTSTPASTPVSKPTVPERIMVKDINQLTTGAKKKSQSPFGVHRRYGQLKTEPASPGVALRKSSPSQRARKTFPHRSRFHAPAYNQSAARFTSLQSNAIKQPNNMVYIPMSTMNFAALANDVPPLAAVSKVSQFKNTSNVRAGQLTHGSTVAATVTPVEQQLVATQQQQQQQPQTVPHKSVPPLVAPLPVITSAATLAPTSTNPPLLQPLTEQHSQKQLQQSQHMLSGYMSEGLAAAISETISNAPPKLTCRPTGALRSDGDVVYPSEAGPISRILIDNSHKVRLFESGPIVKHFKNINYVNYVRNDRWERLWSNFG
jgi:protein kinase C-binding protein 1